MNKTIAGLLLLALIISACTSQTTPKTQCTSDEECVPVQCCHATSAINKDFAPDCQGKICTLDCAPNTLDCGQGEIKCINNQCTAVITS